MGCPLIELDPSWRLGDMRKPPNKDWEYKLIWLGLGGIMICVFVLVVLVFFNSDHWRLVRSLMKKPPKKWDPRHAWPWDPNAPSISSNSSSSISKSPSDPISSLELAAVDAKDVEEGKLRNPRTVNPPRKWRVMVAPQSPSVISFPSIGSENVKKSAKVAKAQPKNVQPAKSAAFKRPRNAAKDLEVKKMPKKKKKK